MHWTLLRTSKKMKNKHKVSIVMAAYNEQGVIEKLIKDYYSKIFLKLEKGSEFIVYLDKPTDDTLKIVKDLSKKLKLKVIEGGKNLGYAGAMKKALGEAKNSLVFYSDTSGKHRAEDFWRLIPLIKSNDIVTGLRKPRTDPFIRQTTSLIQRIIVSILFLIPPYDYNTGYKILRKKVLNELLNKCIYMNESFSSELLIRAYKKDYKIVQVPVEFKDRTADKATATNIKKLPKIIKNSLLGYFKLFFEIN